MTTHKMTKNKLLNIALELCEADNYEGVCHACGEIRDCCEPDARKYHCESCDEDKVYGAEETVLMLGDILIISRRCISCSIQLESKESNLCHSCEIQERAILFAKGK